MLRLLSELAEEGNAWKIAEEFSLSLWNIRLLRLEPQGALRYVLAVISKTSTRAAQPPLLLHISTKAKACR